MGELGKKKGADKGGKSGGFWEGTEDGGMDFSRNRRTGGGIAMNGAGKFRKGGVALPRCNMRVVVGE